MVEPNYNNLFKILIIGDSGVGKSSILRRFCDDEFDDKQLSTIGVDFKVKYLSAGGKRVKLAVWDTAGQERFRTLTSTYYRGAQGIILVHDVTDRNTFEHLDFWLDEVKKYSTNTDAIKMLIANKIDKDGEQVPRSEAEDFAFNNSMLFIETSAKTKKGIKEAFEELALKVLDTPSLLVNTAPLGSNQQGTRLQDGNQNANQNGCC